MKNKKIVLIVVAILVVAGLSFWGGEKYAQGKNSVSLASRQGTFNQNGTFGQNGMRNSNIGARNNMMAGGLVAGEVISKDDKSITIKLRDGGSKIVLFSPSTKVEKTVDGLASDVVIGKQVTVVGTANTDGSVSATSIQMRPTTSPMMQVRVN